MNELVSLVIQSVSQTVKRSDSQSVSQLGSLSVCLSVCQSVYLFLSLCLSPFFRLFFSLSIGLCPSLYLLVSVYLSICLCVCLLFCAKSFHLSVLASFSLPVCTSSWGCLITWGRTVWLIMHVFYYTTSFLTIFFLESSKYNVVNVLKMYQYRILQLLAQ